jgi:hypothetical protein
MAAMARRLAGNLADFQARVQASPGASDIASLATARKHWSGFAATMSRLQGLAEKELKGEMFSTEDQRFLKDTVVIHEREADTSCKTAPDDDGNDDPPDSETTDTVPTVRSYSGWYCDLLYPSASGIDQFMPTVADVHTDSNAGTVLEAGAGRADLVVVAVDNGIDRMAFVGPISTYYEFRQPVDRRMTDEEFKDRLTTSSEADPERPEWFKGIYAPAK